MIEQKEKTKRVYAHVRVHGLAASVEGKERDGHPVVLYDEGGQRVVSASPEAQRHGVRPGMSRWEAERACPELVAAAPNPEKHAYFWQRLVEICGDYSPHLCSSVSPQRGSPTSHCDISLDLTGTRLLFGPAKEIALEIRNRLRAEIGVVASVGIGPNRTIARLACESAKPGAVVEVAPQDAAEFVGRLPIGALPGVDVDWAQRLSDMGIRRAKELAALPVDAVERAFGEQGRKVWEIARGEEREDGIVAGTPAPAQQAMAGGHGNARPTATEQAISAQVEVRPATDDRARVRAALRAAADDVTRRLRQQGKVARQVEIVIVFSDMRAIGARRTLGQPTRSSEVIFRAAGALFERMKLGGRLVRRLRIMASRLAVGPHGGQLGLPIQEREERRERLAERVNQLKDRFGESAVVRASAFETVRR